MKRSINSKCPCGSGKKYKKCCRIFHKGAYPKDILSLMKSRYSAFAMQEIDYIIKTSLYQNNKQELLEFSRNCEFKKLEIIEVKDNFVIFKAFIECGGVDNSFCEKSYFKKVDGKWKYERGEFLGDELI